MLRRAMKLSAVCVRMMVVIVIKYLPKFADGLVNRLMGLAVGGGSIRIFTESRYWWVMSTDKLIIRI